MAVWGDTHSKGIEADAQRAVTAALQMRGALAKLNTGWKENPDRNKLSIGVGVNHGEVIVGNIGHPRRMEFTVLGDGVNLAARLESATKQFHTDILVGEQVEKLTREHFRLSHGGFDDGGRARRSRSRSSALLSDRSLPPPAWLATYHEAHQTLPAPGNFRRPRHAFILTMPGRKSAAKIFSAPCIALRCAAYEQKPPPADWDGSFTL